MKCFMKLLVGSLRLEKYNRHTFELRFANTEQQQHFLNRCLVKHIY